MGLTMSKVLVIEDGVVTRAPMVSMLNRLGLDTLVAGDGERGLQLFFEHLPDLVLVDMSLPLVDGVEVIRQIRAKYPEQKIIGISALGEALEKAESAGVDAVIPKPFGLREFAETVQNCLAAK